MPLPYCISLFVSYHNLLIQILWHGAFCDYKVLQQCPAKQSHILCSVCSQCFYSASLGMGQFPWICVWVKYHGTPHQSSPATRKVGMILLLCNMEGFMLQVDGMCLVLSSQLLLVTVCSRACMGEALLSRVRQSDMHWAWIHRFLSISSKVWIESDL